MTAIELEKKTIEMLGASYQIMDTSFITRDTDIKAELSPSSLKMLGFVSTLEKELDVEIPLNQATKLKTVGEIIDLIAEQV